MSAIEQSIEAGARYLLTCDTAGATVEVGLLRFAADGGGLLPVCERSITAPREANQLLLPTIDALLREQGVGRGQLSAVVVGRGPGSFTGVRIGVATAKGLAQGLGIPLYGVSTTDAVAWAIARRLAPPRGSASEMLLYQQASAGERCDKQPPVGRDDPARLCPEPSTPPLHLAIALDAMRKEVYPALFELEADGAAPRRLRPDYVATPEAAAADFVAAMQPRHSGQPLYLAGDGLAKYESVFREAARAAGLELVTVATPPLGFGLAEAWQASGYQRDTGDAAAVLPIYTRYSDAEESEARRASRTLEAPGDDAPRAPALSIRPLLPLDVPAMARLEADYAGGLWTAGLIASEFSAPDRLLFGAFECVRTQGDGCAVRQGDGSSVSCLNVLASNAFDETEEPSPCLTEAKECVKLYVPLTHRRLVAYAMCAILAGELHVFDVVCDPAWRRQGLATRLLQACFEAARARATGTATLEVRRSNEAARQLYERLGFKRVGTRPGYYPGGEDALIYNRELLSVRQIEQLWGPQRPLRVLALETSCDETAAAVLEGEHLLSNIVASQIPFHARFGGVVPEIASRKHTEAIVSTVEAALEQASTIPCHCARSRRIQENQQQLDPATDACDDTKNSNRDAPEQLPFSALDALAVTDRPGLIGALIVGLAYAKGLSWATGLPLYGVNHLEGHLYATVEEGDTLHYPLVALIVSGGHTLLVSAEAPGAYRVLGSTLDDATGEAFDKVAKALGLPYPGGPELSRLAVNGDPAAIDFPRALLHSGDYAFSLSGLKTAVITYIAREREAGRALDLPDLAASFQQAVIDVQVAKAGRAVEETGARAFYLAGGVAANTALREALTAEMGARDVEMHVPPLALCGDNAAMIGRAFAAHVECVRGTYNLTHSPDNSSMRQGDGSSVSSKALLGRMLRHETEEPSPCLTEPSPCLPIPLTHPSAAREALSRLPQLGLDAEASPHSDL
ncbi:MAG: tRNA (adenosine(37)-N6)-threonylcarbamoyltransferase complex transferase subunit TsaD [Coriobacteriia bacterium]|nr:tRNA (adenosine(37)-N6)-threonylcarbamoyltransferase complex transferase subunit TsaD [Coriobacteriia bacterium]